MMYAIDFTDPGLRMFVNEYVKVGGSKDLKCYVGYFERTNKNEKLDIISIQRLVDSNISQIDQNILRKEEVKKLRLERK